MRKITFLILAVLMLAALAVPALAQGGTIADIAAGNEDFSILVRAVQAADPTVREALSGPGPLTVFAPTNQAFRNLASSLDIDLEALLADDELVTSLLLYHVIQGTYFSGQLIGLDGTTIPTLYGGTALGITVNNGVITVNRVADVVAPFDVSASNGVVHAIDQVIFPRILQERLANVGKIANVRVGHFSPDARFVDVYVDGALALERLGFGTLTEWVQVPAGTREVVVVPAGLPISAEVVTQEATEETEEVVETVSNALIGPAQLELAPDSWTSILAIGLRADSTLSPLVLTEDYSRIADSEARVTVLHAIPDAPAVDVLAEGAAVISNLAFGQTQTLTVPANTYDLAVVATGTTEPVVLDLENTTLRSFRYYFVAAIGTLDDPQVVVASTAGADVFPPPAEEE